MVEGQSVLAPGSLLPPGRLVPRGQLWAGTPARYVRDLTADEVGFVVSLCLVAIFQFRSLHAGTVVRPDAHARKTPQSIHLMGTCQTSCCSCCGAESCGEATPGNRFVHKGAGGAARRVLSHLICAASLRPCSNPVHRPPELLRRSRLCRAESGHQAAGGVDVPAGGGARGRGASCFRGIPGRGGAAGGARCALPGIPRNIVRLGRHPCHARRHVKSWNKTDDM